MASNSEKQYPDVESLPIDKPQGRRDRFDAGSDKPSDDDMGFNDPGNVLWINMKKSDMDEKTENRVKVLEEMMQLTCQLATIHCGQQVMKRKEEGGLPEDYSENSSWRRSQYRIRVLETYFQDGVYPWMFLTGSNSVNKKISVEKSKFHWELLSILLAGILLPGGVASALEAIFQSIARTINETQSTAEKRSFWCLLQVYTYDDVRGDVRATLRNINYDLEQDMCTVVKSKSTSTTINVAFNYVEKELSFNESSWNEMKPEVKSYINEIGKGNIRDPPTVPV